MSSSTTHPNDSHSRETTLASRIATDPVPLLRWLAVALVLLALEFGAFIGGLLTLLHASVLAVTGLLDIFLGALSSGIESSILSLQKTLLTTIDGVRSAAEGLPTLLSRGVIPNQGHMAPGGGWEGTFLGLPPGQAWALRMLLIVVYALFAAYWLFRGWMIYRDNYRQTDWTPTDDIINRLRGHRWGQFGILVLVLFTTIALFGPALGPTTVQQNIQSPYSHDIQYLSEETGAVETVTAGEANFNSKSKGKGTNVGPMTYDDYGRYHPFGTLPSGRDLFTFMMAGARITLIVAGMSIGVATGIAGGLGLISSYYSGTVDLGVLAVAEGIVSVPQLLLIIMISAVFSNSEGVSWLLSVLDGGLLLILIFGFTTWPGLWRAVRGPSLQVAQAEWVDAAESFGQRSSLIMWKHMFPYVMGYLLVYASMSAGGIIISMSALSFLGNGLGITAPTPAWGRAISLGQPYVSGPSWHIAFVPGIMIVVLVTGLNAFGDGLRDAIDPESETQESEEAATGGGA